MVRLVPLLGAVAACLIAFASMSIRQIGDATRRLAASEAEAHKIAYEDPVTGLPNRRMMSDLLDAALAERGAGNVSFALLDIDGFADINEALGEQGSEELLAAVAERLRAVMPRDVTLGRVGPSEFAIVATDAAGTQGLAAAQAAVKVMAKPLWIANQAVQAGVTVGLVHAPHDGETRDELNRRADLARRAGQGERGARICGFDPDMEQEFQDRLFIKRELRRTLAEQGFDVHYQPIVAAEGQRIVGVEALLRWNHPTRGTIPPAVFIPVAEQTGLMVQLGDFVLRRALADAARWRDLYIAVNLSPVQVRDRALVEPGRRRARRYRHPAVARDAGNHRGRADRQPGRGARSGSTQLHALGVQDRARRFRLRLFEPGLSAAFPIDKLKIDRSFVPPLGRSSNGGVIIQAIMALGRALGLTVLARASRPRSSACCCGSPAATRCRASCSPSRRRRHHRPADRRAAGRRGSAQGERVTPDMRPRVV